MCGVLQLQVRYGSVCFCHLRLRWGLPPLNSAPAPPPPALLSSLAFFSIFSSSKVKFPIDFCVVLFVLYTLFVFIMRIADTFGEKAKSKCQHHLTSRRNEKTTTMATATLRRRNPLQSQQHFHRRLRSMRFRSLPNVLWRTVPWPNWLRLQLLSRSLFLSCSSLTSSGVSSIVARCKLQVAVAVAVCGFVFHFWKLIVHEVNGEQRQLPLTLSPSSAPAATLACAASSLPASVPSAVHAVCEYQSFAFNAAFPRIDWEEVSFRLAHTL